VKPIATAISTHTSSTTAKLQLAPHLSRLPRVCVRALLRPPPLSPRPFRLSLPRAPRRPARGSLSPTSARCSPSVPFSSAPSALTLSLNTLSEREFSGSDGEERAAASERKRESLVVRYTQKILEVGGGGGRNLGLGLDQLGAVHYCIRHERARSGQSEWYERLTHFRWALFCTSRR